jgi:hypothetical protein
MTTLDIILSIISLICLIGLVAQTVRIQYFKDYNYIDKRCNEIYADRAIEDQLTISKLKDQKGIAIKQLEELKLKLVSIEPVIPATKVKRYKIKDLVTDKEKYLTKEEIQSKLKEGMMFEMLDDNFFRVVEEDEPYNTIHEETMQDDDILKQESQAYLDHLDKKYGDTLPGNSIPSIHTVLNSIKVEKNSLGFDYPDDKAIKLEKEFNKVIYASKEHQDLYEAYVNNCYKLGVNVNDVQLYNEWKTNPNYSHLHLKPLNELTKEEAAIVDRDWNDPSSHYFKEWFGECNCIHCTRRRGNRTHQEYIAWKQGNRSK